MSDAVQIKIEKGVPIPAFDRFASGGIYKFDVFAVGDSAFYPGTGKEGSQLRSSLTQYARRHDRKFATRTVTESGVPGIRVWRIE